MLSTVVYKRAASVLGSTGRQNASRLPFCVRLSATRWNSSSNDNFRSDEELCREYYNIFNLGKKLLEAQDNTVEMERLQCKVEPGSKGAASRLYVALRDPLFKRYQVDVLQAIDGAKFALETVLRLLGSKEFAEYAASSDSSQVKPETVMWLTELLDHELFERELAQRRKAMNMGKSVLLKELEMGDVWFIAAASQIVEEPPLPLKWVHYLTGKPYTPPYPLGAVSAFLDVKCRVKQDRVRLLSPAAPIPTDTREVQGKQEVVEEERQEVERHTVEVGARFKACISGQVPLQWRLYHWSAASGEE